MRKYDYESYYLEPTLIQPMQECICNISATLPTTSTTINLSANHTTTTKAIAEKLDHVEEVNDDDDAPPQDLLDALVLGDVGRKMKTNYGFCKSQQEQDKQQQQQQQQQLIRPNQVVFAKNVTFKKTGDLV